MENDFSFMDMGQYGHPEQITNVAPSIIQHQHPHPHQQPMMVGSGRGEKHWRLGLASAARANTSYRVANDSEQNRQATNKSPEIYGRWGTADLPDEGGGNALEVCLFVLLVIIAIVKSQRNFLVDHKSRCRFHIVSISKSVQKSFRKRTYSPSMTFTNVI
jgi:hypothetical protein